MPRDARKYLFDIQQATQLLFQFTAGRTADDYAADALLRSAVERQFEIIGEALSQLRRVDEGAVSRVTDAGRIIAFRNILIHGYADVDHRLVWNIVETKLQTLAEDVARLMADEPL